MERVERVELIWELARCNAGESHRDFQDLPNAPHLLVSIFGGRGFGQPEASRTGVTVSILREVFRCAKHNNIM